MGRPFTDRTFLVPEARVGKNMLAAILRRLGADVRAFPTLTGRPTADPEPLERAMSTLETYDWIVIVGALSALFFLDRWDNKGPITPKLLTIGKDTRSEIRARARPPDAAPREHTADAIAEALGIIDGARILLLRSDRASTSLPRELTHRGAHVDDVAAFEILVELSTEQIRAAFAPPLDMVIFGNPSAARLFPEALRSRRLDIEQCLAGIVVATVGPATARVAIEQDLEPDLVAGGHLADLVRTLRELWINDEGDRPRR